LRKLPVLTGKRIKVILYRGNLEYFITEYMKMEAMIVTRFHAMVLSLMANQFVYPFIYNIKMINVLNDLKYSGSYSFIDNIDSIEHIIDGLKSKKYSLPLSDVRSSAEKQFSALDNFINNRVVQKL
jgi:colanic acid/amylovoran biosynthesis protein